MSKELVKGATKVAGIGAGAYLGSKMIGKMIDGKKKKVKERFFNYIVLVDPKNKTLIEKRIKKDIWFKLNQFPLIETNFKVENIKKVSSFIKFINSQKILIKTNTFLKYNIKHVLSHQVLYMSFYIFKTEKDIPLGIDLLKLSNYNFPVPINNFINKKLL